MVKWPLLTNRTNLQCAVILGVFYLFCPVDAQSEPVETCMMFKSAPSTVTATEPSSLPNSDQSSAANKQNVCIGDHPKATGPDQSGCPSITNYAQGLIFDDEKHKLWYDRFWNGKCDGLGVFDFCQEDNGHWIALIDQLSSVLNNNEDKSLLQANLWSAGRYIGHEWAKENSIRKIDTKQIQIWYKKLETSQSPITDLQSVCNHAEQLMK